MNWIALIVFGVVGLFLCGCTASGNSKREASGAGVAEIPAPPDHQEWDFQAVMEGEHDHIPLGHRFKAIDRRSRASVQVFEDGSFSAQLLDGAGTFGRQRVVSLTQAEDGSSVTVHYVVRNNRIAPEWKYWDDRMIAKGRPREWSTGPQADFERALRTLGEIR